MREDIWKDGIKTQFSKDNQPAPEKKRVPKLKAQLKRDLAKNYKEISKKIIDRSKDGSIKHIEFVRDWLYGKVTDKLDATVKADKTILEIIAEQLNKNNEIQRNDSETGDGS